MPALTEASMTTIENLKNFLEHELVMESNVNDTYTPRLSQIYAALRELTALVATVERLRAKPDAQGLDAPDSPGWWAFRGHWSTLHPEKAIIFHHVWDVYLMTDGELYFQRGNDGHPVAELTGQWYRLSWPWDTAPVEVQPVCAYCDGTGRVGYPCGACGGSGQQPPWMQEAEVQPVPVESLRRLLALCRSRYETTGRLGYELVEVEAWLDTLQQRPAAEAGA